MMAIIESMILPDKFFSEMMACLWRWIGLKGSAGG